MPCEETYEITWLVRRLFRAMAERSNDRLVEFDISAADRAVLEFLYPDELLSVPEIADRYDVSRQHVQVTVNRLTGKGLVVAKPNPRHKRSSLIRLTPVGKRLFSRVIKSDRKLIAGLFAGIQEDKMRATRETLQILNERLKEGED